MSEPQPCALCGRPVDERFRPFCSKRCVDVDLANWLSDRYAIPVADDEDPEPRRVPGQDDEA